MKNFYSYLQTNAIYTNNRQLFDKLVLWKSQKYEVLYVKSAKSGRISYRENLDRFVTLRRRSMTSDNWVEFFIPECVNKTQRFIKLKLKKTLFVSSWI